MKTKSIEKEYKKKIKLFKKYNEYYFNKSKPLVPDYIYDKLKNEILSIENENKNLNSKDSPSKILGFKPSKNFNKISHQVPMLSLSNAFTKEDLINFRKKILNFLDKDNDLKIEFTAEPKIDGISASLNYKNGLFVSGLSRGDGKIGEDITENLKTIQDIPLYLNGKNFPKEIDVRGEVYIQSSDFIKIKDKFANPRNAASCSLRQKNPNETKKIPLKFIAYSYGYVDKMIIDTQFKFLEKLKEWGFKTNPLNKLFNKIDDLIKNYQDIEKKRIELDFDID